MKKIKNMAAEIMLILSALLFVIATMRINITATLYLVGFLSLISGIFVAWSRR